MDTDIWLARRRKAESNAWPIIGCADEFNAGRFEGAPKVCKR